LDLHERQIRDIVTIVAVLQASTAHPTEH